MGGTARPADAGYGSRSAGPRRGLPQGDSSLAHIPESRARRAGFRWFHFAAVFVVMVSASSLAAHWPQYRGPGALGLEENQPLPTHWNIKTGQNVRWQTYIPGLAHASPIVWDDRVYVATVDNPTTADLVIGLYGDITPVDEKEPHQWRLLAVDRRTGKVIWNTLGYEGVPRVKRHPKASHCNSTPATDGKRIVAIFGSEGLFCFEADGKLAWKKDLGPMQSAFFRVPSAQWGFASSPIIHDGKVIVLCDVLTNSFLASYALADGKELWRTPREDVPTWGTPALVQSPGRQQIVVNGWHYTGGYDFQTGQNLWRLDEGGDIPVPTPIAAHGLIYLTSAHGRYAPIRAVRQDAAGDITPKDPGQTNASIAWAHARRGNYMQTPIVVGNRLFACGDNGRLTCFDARTGAVEYNERLSTGNEGFSASPVSDGRHLYFPSERGMAFVVPASGPFSVVATNDLGESCMATPAIAEGALLFRTRDKLVAVGAPSPPR